MTPQQLAKLQRDFLIAAEKQSAVFLNAEFERIKREITEYLTKNLSGKPTLGRLYESDFLDNFLEVLTKKIDILSNPAARIVSRAQTNVIRLAAGSLKKYFNFKFESSIFSPDREAIRNLIGRAFEGRSLQTVFNRMKEPMANRARVELVEGFALGESNTAIARRMASVTDLGRRRALVISRNETVMAYRNASTEFYAEAGIKEYRFLSALDARTCLVCWRLHGTKWKLKEKPHIHVSCRCVISPVVSGLKEFYSVKKGTDLFKSLEKGVQKQILGEKRFHLFESGDYGLGDFVGIKESKEFGNTHYVRPLDELKQS